MTQFRIKVSAEITQDVYIVWSPEYGATVLGDPERVSIEEMPHRDDDVVRVPVLTPPVLHTPAARRPRVVADREPGPCLICDCPGPHDPGKCPHECLTYVEA